MSFISYAQNYEDVMLWRALRRVEHGFYIDVGAAWPDQDSVTKHFYRQGWHGINIEPNPTLFQQYSRERPDDINLQVAVSDEPGETEIYMVADTGLSSLSHEVVKDHVRLGYAYHSERVQVLTLQEICKEYVKGRDVHFLKIDVEGWEERVLKSNDWGYCRPWIVVVEATKPMTEVESYSASESILLKIGYRFVYADGLNRYY
ncbi:MAG: FkbM family methyltransferase, partial [Candidimonas sp.]